MRQTIGAPPTTPARNTQPVARPARGPRPAVTEPITPPADGICLPRAENTAANRPDRITKPGDDRGRPGLGGGEAGEEQQAGAQESPDVEGSAARGRQALRCSGLVHGCQCHRSTMADLGSNAMANIAPEAVVCATLLRDQSIRVCFMSEQVPDSVDRAIVTRLQRDGRIANVDLADAISLSPSACLRRVKALEASGIIAG